MLILAVFDSTMQFMMWPYQLMRLAYWSIGLALKMMCSFPRMLILNIKQTPICSNLLW